MSASIIGVSFRLWEMKYSMSDRASSINMYNVKYIGKDVQVTIGNATFFYKVSCPVKQSSHANDHGQGDKEQDHTEHRVDSFIKELANFVSQQ